MEVRQEIVDTINGQKIEKYTLINDNDIRVGLLTFGATWQEFLIPDGNGGHKNVIIGFDKPSVYVNDTLCAGQSIGRVAGRIDGGKAVINGEKIQLPQTEKGNCHHGGLQGFHQQVWKAFVEAGKNALTVVMVYDAKESVDQFPGDMQVEVRFTLDNANRFTIAYTGKNATKATLFNPTNHVYFNLGERQDLSQHTFTVEADTYLETRDDLVPTGKILNVDQTAYDFRKGQNLGEAIEKTGGLDDAFIVEGNLDTPCGVLKDEESGDSVSIYSNRNALVVYSMGGIPDNIYPARDKGAAAKEFEAVALEAQFLPDAINHDGFGDITLLPNEEKTYTIAFEYHRG